MPSKSSSRSSAKSAAKPKSKPLTFDELKDKQRRLRPGFPEPLGLRVHRAISWFGRAMDADGDPDVRFILLWIGFNAAYAGHIESDSDKERDGFRVFFGSLLKLDPTHRIYDAVWDRFPQEVRALLANKYVFQPFWHHQNGVPGYGNWEDRLAASQRDTQAAMARFDTVPLLRTVFDRLYVLRNQLVHGGATWNGKVNRAQVRDGAAVMAWMLPVFIDIMMDNPGHDWGQPYYPVVS
jgi:hypothetical protein